MRHILSTLFLSFLLLVQVQAQPDLRQDFADYFAAMQQKRWTEVLDYLHPMLFDFASQEEILQAFESLDGDTSLRITFSDPAITQNPLAMSEGDQRYALLPYRYQMHMELLMEDATQRDQLVSFYRTYYDREAFTYDPKSQTASLRMDKQLFAVLSPGQDRWLFIENNADASPLLDQVIPAQIRDELERGLRIEAADH